MNKLKEQVNIEQLATKLKELQDEFSQYDGLQGYLNAKPLNVDFEVNKNEIVINFDLSKDNAITVEVKKDCRYDDLANVAINFIEVDNVAGTYMLDSDDTSALLIECKRIIHDAVHYKLLNDNEPQPYDTMKSLGFTNSDFLYG